MAVRAALAPIAAEPLPPELNLARMLEARRRPRLEWTRWAAAAVVLLCVGGGAGWSVRGATEHDRHGIVALAGEAADSYQVYASNRVRPVEMGESDRAARPAGLGAGFLQLRLSVQGGRLVATPHGPAVLFMYDDPGGTRLVLYTRGMTVDRNMPMSRHARDGLEGVAWSNQGVGYTLVTPWWVRAPPRSVRSPTRSGVR